MRKKTIGEVLRLARINQGLSLEDLQKKTDIQYELLEALEEDDFDRIPSPFYTRSFLRKYAWAVDLDESIVLEAYEEGSMIAYDEVEVDEDSGIRSRRERKKRSSYLPIFYFSAVSILILLGLGYYVWSYVRQNPVASTDSSSYSLVNSSQEAASSSEVSTSSSEETSSTSSILVSGEGSAITAELNSVTSSVKVDLSVADSTSWISVTGTDLEGGVTLSSENPTATTNLEPGTTSVITLGVVKGVTITVNGQKLDLSKLTADTGVVTLVINQ